MSQDVCSSFSASVFFVLFVCPCPSFPTFFSLVRGGGCWVSSCPVVFPCISPVQQYCDQHRKFRGWTLRTTVEVEYILVPDGEPTEPVPRGRPVRRCITMYNHVIAPPHFLFRTPVAAVAPTYAITLWAMTSSFRRMHLAINPGLYSMEDLIGVKNGNLPDFLEEVTRIYSK